MSSDKGLIASPVVAPAVPEAAPGLSAEAFATDPGRSRSLKRTRESTPTSTSPTASIDGLSPSKIARLVGFARDSPVPPPLTGAAAIEDERLACDEEGHRPDAAGISEHPGHRVLSDLMAGVEAMSRLQDAPSAQNSAAIHPQLKDVSPQSSTGHAASLEHGSQVAHSPTPVDVEPRTDQRLYAPQPDAQMVDRTTGSSPSYPGVVQPGASLPPPVPAQRGMTAPTGAPQPGDVAPRSPQSSNPNKKHKCPYCETEFTRHHNLKSHLLTHSQEKPYVCQTCNLRFRRLHDLKRHSKLHTGEKPHVCPKCDRKFARGDALARHSKGAGGCAGRRTSMGGFGDDDFEGTSATDVDDSVMTGLAYADGTSDADMADEERRSLSLPSMKAQQPGQSESYNAHSNTYPPAGQRPGASEALFAQNIDQAISSSPNVSNAGTLGAAAARGGNAALSGNPGSSLFAQGAMAESPKPISPAAAEAQPRATHAQYRVLEQAAKGVPLPTHGNATAAHLRGSSITANAATAATKATAPVDNANNLFASGEQGVWAYMQHLDDKVKQLTAEVDACHDQVKQLTDEVESSKQTESRLSEQIIALTTEVESLRHQLAGPSMS